MIGLEYILKLYGIQHQELAEMLEIKKQNINLWVKGKQNISKKYLPELSIYFNIPEEFFQKELNQIDRLEIQKRKLQKEMKPVGYQQQLIFEGVNDSGETQVYNDELQSKMNELKFEMEKALIAKDFIEVLAPVTKDNELVVLQLLLTLFKEHGNEPKLRFIIKGTFHYFDNLVEKLKNPENNYINDFTELVDKYYDLTINE